jgi:hypothetical protein
LASLLQTVWRSRDQERGDQKIDHQREHVLDHRSKRSGAERWIVAELGEQPRQQEADGGRELLAAMSAMATVAASAWFPNASQASR